MALHSSVWSGPRLRAARWPPPVCAHLSASSTWQDSAPPDSCDHTLQGRREERISGLWPQSPSVAVAPPPQARSWTPLRGRKTALCPLKAPDGARHRGALGVQQNEAQPLPEGHPGPRNPDPSTPRRALLASVDRERGPPGCPRAGESRGLLRVGRSARRPAGLHLPPLSSQRRSSGASGRGGHAPERSTDPIQLPFSVVSTATTTTEYCQSTG